MKKIITPTPPPYPEIAEPLPLTRWEEEAIESLQSLERYTVLKAIDEGKRLVKSVMEVAAKDAGEDHVVMKFHVQNAIALVLDELESSRQRQTPSAS